MTDTRLELSIIKTVVLSSPKFPLISELSNVDFNNPESKKLFDLVQNNYADGSLASLFSNNDINAIISDEQYLCIDDVEVLGESVTRLKNLTTLRLLHIQAKTIIALCEQNNTLAIEMTLALPSRIAKSSGANVCTFDQAILQAEQIISGDSSMKVFTGYDTIDKKYGGIPLGKLVVIAALSQNGKTSFIEGLIRYNLEIPNTYITAAMTEVKPAESVLNLLPSRIDISRSVVYRGESDKLSYNRVGMELSKLKGSDYNQRLFYDKGHELSTILATKAIRIQRKRTENPNIKPILILDFLKVMTYKGKSIIKEEMTAEAVGAIARFAEENECLVILGTQLNQDYKTRQNKEPIISDMYNPSSYEQYAYSIIFTHQPERTEGCKTGLYESQRYSPALINVQKWKNNGHLYLECAFDKKHVAFVEGFIGETRIQVADRLNIAENSGKKDYFPNTMETVGYTNLNNNVAF